MITFPFKILNSAFHTITSVFKSWLIHHVKHQYKGHFSILKWKQLEWNEVTALKKGQIALLSEFAQILSNYPAHILVISLIQFSLVQSSTMTCIELFMKMYTNKSILIVVNAWITRIWHGSLIPLFKEMVVSERANKTTSSRFIFV